ncbi:MAG: hypothetical protein QHI48_03790 [Bacteroidota bacterium]|nr:hypothetical protein [Bacteroidota bacterium]
MNITHLVFDSQQKLGISQFATETTDTLQYICGETAVKEGLLEVLEVDRAGDVNRLTVINHAEIPVFLMDGDLLVGAKQNRVVNTSVFLAPKAKIIIPVSCVERGRWHFVSSGFTFYPSVAPMSLRCEKSRQVSEHLRMYGLPDSDQGEIWDLVERYHSALRSESPTRSITDIISSRESKFSEFVSRFSPDDSANGLAVFMDRKLVAIDIFDRRDVYRTYFPKIVRAAAVDVFAARSAKSALTPAEAFFVTAETLDAVEELPKETHPGVSLGEERRFSGEEYAGFALYYADRLVHLSVSCSSRFNEGEKARRG